jgi:hypothetical protein
MLPGDNAPQIRVSPSGSFTVRLEWSNPLFHRSNFISLSKHGLTLWRKRWPYPLASAFVDDAGRIVAWGEDDHVAGGYANLTLRVVFVAPNGEISKEDATARQQTGELDSSPIPVVDKFIGDPSGERLYVVISRSLSAAAQWLQYDFATGTLIKTRSLLDSEPAFRAEEAIIVPGSGLIAALYRGVPDAELPSVSLLDKDGKSTGMLSLPRDFQPVSSLLSEKPAQLHAGPVHFQLDCGTSLGDATLHIEIKRQPNGGFSLVPHSLTLAPRPPAPPEPPEVSLTPTNIVKLGCPNIGLIAMGPTGRIYIKDKITRNIVAFDQSGRRIFATAALFRTDGFDDDYFSRLCPVPDGGVLYDREAFTPHPIRFDQAGQAVASTEESASPANGVWTRAGFSDSNGKVMYPISHDAFGRGILRVDSVASAPNGSAAVLDTDPFEDRNYSFITTFNADGLAIRTFRVPRCDEVAYDGNLVVVNPGNAIVAYSLTSKLLWSARFHSRSTPFLYQGSLFLWAGGDELIRYALPKE